MTLLPYIRLMRLHQPTGIWLLLWPCWWSLALAGRGFPPVELLLLFALGAVLMRGAGCIVNDMADRKLDQKVERTKNRPLASGEISMMQASVFLAVLLCISFAIALALGPIVILWALLSLLPVVMYPFMKRISWWPQLFLGLTFNWGALMGWAAVRGAVEMPALLLYTGGVFWTLGYDTIYAHQDKNDDALAGIKSTARRLGEKTKPALAVFYGAAMMFWALTGFTVHASFWFFIFLGMVILQFSWQIYVVQLEDPASCRHVFAGNRRMGWLMFIGCVLVSI